MKMLCDLRKKAILCCNLECQLLDVNYKRKQGQFFYADIASFEELHSEIETILITDKLVNNWTYPLIQPKLIEEAQKRGFI